MKRELLCSKCAKDQRDLFPTDNPYPGEYLKFVYGHPKPMPIFCDACNKGILPGERICAFTCYTDTIPYHSWEDEYLQKEESCQTK